MGAKNKHQKRAVESILQEIQQRNKKEPLRAYFRILEDSINEEDRTVAVAFSSDKEYERWWGIEILSHDAGAVNMERMDDGAAVLWNHNWHDQRGVVESASIDKDNFGRAIVKISRTPDGEALWMDIVDKIKRHISVGYMIDEMKLTEEREYVDVYTVTKWTPYEISFVSVPADTSVGVGRSANDNSEPPVEPPVVEDGTKQTPKPKTTGEKTMTEEERLAAEQAEQQRIADARAEAQTAERNRVRDIHDIANNFDGFDETARQHIADGKSVEEFRIAVMTELGKRQGAIPEKPITQIGMNTDEIRTYSILKVALALKSGNWEDAEFERECSEKVAKKLNKEARGLFIPYEIVAQRSIMPKATAERAGLINTGTIAEGGQLVDDILMSNQLIELLRERTIAGALGVKFIGGLTGDLTIPKVLTGSATYWLDEDENQTDSDVTFGSITMKPKTVSAAVPITRKMLQQSSVDIEALVWNEIFSSIALAIDAAIFSGDSAQKQPTGILNTVGVGTVDFASLATPTYAEFVSMETKYEDDTKEALGSPQFVLRSSIKGYCKTTQPAAGIPRFIWEDGKINGYSVTSTRQVPGNTTLFGDFSQVIVGLWGIMDVELDKATKAPSGGIVLRAFKDVDVAVRHPQAFIKAVQAS